MKYVKPMVTIYDEEVMKEIEAAAASTCNCTGSGSRVCYAPTYQEKSVATQLNHGRNKQRRHIADF